MSEALMPATGESSAVTDRRVGGFTLPQVIIAAGPDAVARFLEFFAGRIANARTRAAYGRAVGQFLAWCEARGLRLGDDSPAPRGRLHPDSPPDRSRPSSSTWPRSACSATGSSSTRSSR